jgi:peptidoglycan/LPS O-acetylase OafA/YrhL
MDSTALVTAIFGAALGAVVAYCVVKRRWWKAAGSLALGGASLMNIVTQGNQSHLEHRLVLDATMILFACFVIAAIGDARARHRILQANSHQAAGSMPRALRVPEQGGNRRHRAVARRRANRL